MTSLAGNWDDKNLPGTSQKWLTVPPTECHPAIHHAFVVGFTFESYSPLPGHFKYTFSDQVSAGHVFLGLLES